MKHSRRRYDAVKRLGDIVFSAVALLVFSPVLLAVALAVRIKLGTPVLFRQQRPGRGGRPFTLYKFRSMHVSTDTGVAAVATDAERLTGLGRFLRNSSLDELPEFWNVFVGDMSLVGPRPLLMEYLPCYSPEQARRHEVRPGITGLAQVNGRNAVPWDERFAMDVYYVDHRSLVLDMRIILRTVAVALSRENVSESGVTTARPFVSADEPPSCRDEPGAQE